MADVRSFEVVLKGNTRSLQRAFQRAQKQTDTFGQRVRRVAKVAAAAAGALALSLGTAAVDGAIKLEKGLSEVRTLLPELTDQGFGKMRQEVWALSNEMGIATSQAVPALYSAISAGVPADNVMSFLETASKTAIGGVTDLATATDALTTVVNTWGKTAGVDAAQAADILFTTVKLGKTTMGELGASINQVAGLASAFNIEFEQVTSGVVELTKAGVPTTEAMTKMRALIQSISSPSIRAAGSFKELGIQVSAARTAQEGILPVVQEIMRATEGNDVLQRKLFGSVEALQAAMVLTTNAGDGYTETLHQMRNAAGAADAAFNTMNESTARQYEMVKVRLTNALTGLGTKVLPHLVEVLGWAAENMDLLLPAVAGVAAAFSALAIALAANPIGLAVIAVGALTAALVVAYQKSETFRRVVRTAFDVVAGAVQMYVGLILGYIGLWVEGLSRAADAVGWLADKVGIDMSGVTDAIGAAAEWLNATGAGLMESGAERIADAWANSADAGEAAADKWTEAWADAQFRTVEAAEVIVDAAAAVTSAVVFNADEQRAAMEAHTREMMGLTEQRIAADAAMAQALDHARSRAGIAAHKMASDFEAMYLAGVAAGEGLAESWEASTGKTLSDAERLAYGMRVTIRDACGAVTGFRQCVDGVVQEFDADMNVVLSDADLLASGLMVTMTNACGAVTGFTQCVDGVVREFDADTNIILSDAEQLARGMSVEMFNACGSFTGFKQCVDGAVVEFDANMDVILSDAERLAAGLMVEMTNACGTVTGFKQCVDGMVHEFDADMDRVLTDAERLAGGMLVTMTNACGTVTGFKQCVDGVVVEFDAGMNRITSAADDMAAGVASSAAAAIAALKSLHSAPGLTDEVYRFARFGFTPQQVEDQLAGSRIYRQGRLQDRVWDSEKDTWSYSDAYPEVPEWAYPMASGGIVRARRGGTLIRVGEAGRDEVVAPLPRGFAAGGAMGRSVTINLTVEGSVITGEDLRDLVIEAELLAEERGESG